MTDSNAVVPPSLAPTDPCPCGSGSTFADCCDAVLQSRRPAETTEQWMRSRYTAQVVHDFKYLHDTYAETASTPYVDEEYGNEIKWTKLEVHTHEAEVRADVSFVDFSAHFEERGQPGVMHERS
ncbi:MAG: SEC-C domain-containing protein [Candidatus Synoicihabitans palmerolidicus]|nr:SEC-C domain-containing protein [Candidatus Synoicihabitans palmerolidicus]